MLNVEHTEKPKLFFYKLNIIISANSFGLNNNQMENTSNYTGCLLN